MSNEIIAASQGIEPYKIITDVSRLTNEEWLQHRHIGIGGSEASAVVNMNPYKSALSLYLEKIDEAKPFEGNIHTRFGKRMEPIIREWFKEDYSAQETPIEVYEYPFLMQSIKCPWMIADIDGIIEHPDYGKGVIEIKTASEMNKKVWKDEEIPDTYYCQIQHYLSVTGLNYCMIIALIGKELIWKYVPRNDEFIKNLVEAERLFWYDNVLKKNPPAPNGSDNAKEALLWMYPEEAKGEILDLSDMAEKRERYKQLASEIKELQQEQEAIKQDFMSNMGTAEIAMVGDKKVTWKTICKKAYTVKESSTRQFRIY